MVLDDYLRALRRTWWAPLLCAVVAVVIALGLAVDRPERSSATVVVRTADDIVGEGGRVSAVESIDGDLLNTLVDLVTSSAVIDPAAEQAGVEAGDYTVAATAGPESHVVVVAATGPDGDDAEALTTALVAEATAQFAGLYDIYRLEVLEATSSASPTGASPAVVAGVAALAGLAFGCLVAFGREWLRLRRTGTESAPEP